MVERMTRHRWLVTMVCGGALLTACAAPGPASSATVSGSSTGPSAGPATGSSAAESPPTEIIESAGGSTAPALPDCTSAGLPTLAPDTLTVGTESPARAPWFSGDDPGSGAGFESAVTYAIAAALGYDRDQVAWTVVEPNAAAAGTVGGFDVSVNQFTAPDVGTATADYSTGYFPVTDTLLMPHGSAAPSSTAGLADLSLGTVAGSASAENVERLAASEAIVFTDQGEALAGLAAGAVTGVVLPVPAALAATAADPSLLLVGALPADPELQPEQFKVLLPKDSALTGCVSAAIDRLRVEGTLDQLADQWVAPMVPELPTGP